jgi:hypothetical protein
MTRPADGHPSTATQLTEVKSTPNRQSTVESGLSPTRQYSKLESIEIAPGLDKIDIKLKAQAGQRIEQGDIEKCLEHTTAKVAK